MCFYRQSHLRRRFTETCEYFLLYPPNTTKTLQQLCLRRASITDGILKPNNAQYIEWKTLELIIHQEEVFRVFLYKFVRTKNKYNCPIPRREEI
jgi:hypothetical protein